MLVRLRSMNLLSYIAVGKSADHNKNSLAVYWVIGQASS